MKMTRRQFLQTLTLAGVSTVVHAGSKGNSDYVSKGVGHEQNLVAHINEVEAARQLGQAYLDVYEDEATKDSLLMHLPISDERHQLIIKLEQHVREDYDQGLLCCLDGWLLSRTEGRLYALFVLTASEA